MGNRFRPPRVLEELTDLSLHGQIDAPHARQLELMLRADADALRWYRDMVSLQMDLRIVMTANRTNQRALAGIDAVANGCPLPLAEQDAASRAEVLKGRSPVLGFLHRALHEGGHSPVVNAAMLLVIVLGAGMLLTLFVGIVLTMSHGVTVHVENAEARDSGLGARDKIVSSSPSPQPPAPSPSASPQPPAPSPSPVARLIHTADCRWADDSDAPEVGDDLAAGRKLALKSGLAEVIFTSGARALLQGPATMEVGSKTSALLHRGRLTVTVEEPEARGFEVRTPGMKYTDLGTEFGVLVAKDGMQEVHVFRGKVEAEREIGRKGERESVGSGPPVSPSPLPPFSPSPPLVLSAHQAIRIAAPAAPGRPAPPIERIAIDFDRFVRSMPTPAPFPIFGTGVGLDRGAADPHWTITKISTDANFKPQPAVVTIRFAGYDAADNRDRGQWVSNAKVGTAMPVDCRWTLRTHFDLTGFDPSTARIEGRIVVDNFLAGIRLNGKDLPLPPGSRDRKLYANWLGLKIEEGFVAGDNTLEIMIDNDFLDSAPTQPNLMGVCLELSGTARPVVKPGAEN